MATKKLTLQEVVALSAKQQAKYMNSLSTEDKAKLLVEAATRALNTAGDKVVGN